MNKITYARLVQLARRGQWDNRMLNGHPGAVTNAVRRTIMRGMANGLVVTSTTDGVHSQYSYHYSGRAVDLGVPQWLVYRPLVVRQHLIRKLYVKELDRDANSTRALYLELFGPGGAYIKNGQKRLGQFPGHTDHIHAAPAGVS